MPRYWGNIGLQEKLVKVHSTVYSGLAVFTGSSQHGDLYWDWKDYSVFIRVGTEYYEIDEDCIVGVVPRGNLSEALYS